MNTPKEYYRGNLPHFQQPGQWYFITCTLAGAIPKNMQLAISENFRNASERYRRLKTKTPNDEVLKPIRQEYYEARKKFFRAQEHILQNSSTSTINLIETNNLRVIEIALRFWEGKRLHNHAWCVMPNHFHT
jgi:putative transposase